MPSLVITIKENIKVVGENVVFAFELDHKVDFEDEWSKTLSRIPQLHEVLPGIIGLAMHLTTIDGGEVNSLEFGTDKSVSLEAVMENFINKHNLDPEVAFPPEIET